MQSLVAALNSLVDESLRPAIVELIDKQYKVNSQTLSKVYLLINLSFIYLFIILLYIFICWCV